MTTHIEAAAQRKAGIDGWEACIFERLDGGLLVTGGIPQAASGKKKFPPTKKMQRIILTEADVTAEKMMYAQTTGRCPNCYGEGQRAVGWNRDTGDKYETCAICAGTGRSGV